MFIKVGIWLVYDIVSVSATKDDSFQRDDSAVVNEGQFFLAAH